MKHPIPLITAICLVALLGSCANSSIGDALEGSLQADPQLVEEPPFGQSGDSPTPPDEFVKLPDDFPQEIAIYPGSSLEDVTLSASDRAETKTMWTTADPINLVQTYYQNKFQSDNWQIVTRPETEGEGSLVATRDDLKVTINLQPEGKSSGKTQFAIDYSRDPKNIASVPKPTASPSPLPTPSESPPVAASPSPSPSPSPTSTPSNTPDSTGEIPPELQKFVKDVAQLGIFKSNFPNPNETITRGEYARALVQANNKIYADNPAKQIRLGVPSDDPVFGDVPTSHPNFSEIQGLAEAGLIPSSLSGDSTAVQFRPDAPLTREDLVLWKVPLDTRQVLPKATVDAVQERWGFQDAAKIDSKALRAVLADFDNGDSANIRRVYGFTTLFQPKKAVTRAEAAAALWYFGFQGDGRSAQDALQAKSDTES